MTQPTTPAQESGDTQRNGPSDGAALWALLIGIDQYKVLRPLHGAVNDVESMRIALLGQYAVPPERISVLTDERATRRAILTKFQRFLIENPDIHYGDQMLIQFCGHGSRMRDPTGMSPNLYCESLVPYDGRTPDVPDIPDRTIAALLNQLAEAKGNNITLILDCCHAGSMSRGHAESPLLDIPASTSIRGVDTDTRPLPVDLDATILSRSSHLGSWGAGVPQSTRGTMTQGWSLSPTHVLLAACRDKEVAHERREHGVALGDCWYGAFSYALIEALSQTPPGTTYAQLHERIVAQVKTTYTYQTPQCEGDRHREVFSGVRHMHTPMITVIRHADGEVTLDAGFVHGLRKGTRLAAFGPASQMLADTTSEPLATLRVESVGATTSTAAIVSGSSVSGASSSALERAKCIVTRHAYEGLRQRLLLSVDASARNSEAAQLALQHLARVIQGDGPLGRSSPYLEVTADPVGDADLHVLVDQHAFRFAGPSGDELAQPILHSADESPAGVPARQAPYVAALNALENIVRYRTVLGLANRDAQSSLAGKLDVSLRRYAPNTPGVALALVERDADGALSVALDQDNEDNNVYVVEVRNHSARDVFAHIFMLSPDYSVARLYPRFGQEESIAPGEPAFIGLRDARERLLLYLPDGWDMSRDHLKVVFTTEPTDLRILEQGGVRVPVPGREQARGEQDDSARERTQSLPALLRDMLDGSDMRYMRPSRDVAESEDWATETITIVTRRAAARQAALPDEDSTSR